eukprot:jgi/Tetstr1/458321/TSEL_000360.t1
MTAEAGVPARTRAQSLYAGFCARADGPPVPWVAALLAGVPDCCVSPLGVPAQHGAVLQLGRSEGAAAGCREDGDPGLRCASLGGDELEALLGALMQPAQLPALPSALLSVSALDLSGQDELWASQAARDALKLPEWRKQLGALRLRATQLDNHEAKMLTWGNPQLFRHLTRLDLSHNPGLCISSSSASLLEDLLRAAPALRLLCLDHTALDGGVATAQSVNKVLAGHGSLKYLSLGPAEEGGFEDGAVECLGWLPASCAALAVLELWGLRPQQRAALTAAAATAGWGHAEAGASDSVPPGGPLRLSRSGQPLPEERWPAMADQEHLHAQPAEPMRGEGTVAPGSGLVGPQDGSEEDNLQSLLDAMGADVLRAAEASVRPGGRAGGAADRPVAAAPARAARSTQTKLRVPGQGGTRHRSSGRPLSPHNSNIPGSRHHPAAGGSDSEDDAFQRPGRRRLGGPHSQPSRAGPTAARSRPRPASQSSAQRQRSSQGGRAFIDDEVEAQGDGELEGGWDDEGADDLQGFIVYGAEPEDVSKRWRDMDEPAAHREQRPPHHRDEDCNREDESEPWEAGLPESEEMDVDDGFFQDDNAPLGDSPPRSPERPEEERGRGAVRKCRNKASLQLALMKARRSGPEGDTLPPSLAEATQSPRHQLARSLPSADRIALSDQQGSAEPGERAVLLSLLHEDAPTPEGLTRTAKRTRVAATASPGTGMPPITFSSSDDDNIDGAAEREPNRMTSRHEQPAPATPGIEGGIDGAGRQVPSPPRQNNNSPLLRELRRLQAWPDDKFRDVHPPGGFFDVDIYREGGTNSGRQKRRAALQHNDYNPDDTGDTLLYRQRYQAAQGRYDSDDSDYPPPDDGGREASASEEAVPHRAACQSPHLCSSAPRPAVERNAGEAGSDMEEDEVPLVQLALSAQKDAADYSRADWLRGGNAVARTSCILPGKSPARAVDDATLASVPSHDTGVDASAGHEADENRQAKRCSREQQRLQPFSWDPQRGAHPANETAFLPKLAKRQPRAPKRFTISRGDAVPACPHRSAGGERSGGAQPDGTTKAGSRRLDEPELLAGPQDGALVHSQAAEKPPPPECALVAAAATGAVARASSPPASPGHLSEVIDDSEPGSDEEGHYNAGLIQAQPVGLSFTQASK